MRKLVFALCEQQRHRSACASAQSDQYLCCSLLSIIPVLALAEISRLYLASAAEQTNLGLTLSKITKTGFLVTWLICK